MPNAQQLQDQLQAAREAQQACYQLLDKLPEEHDSDSPEHENWSRAHEATRLIGALVNDLSLAATDAAHAD